jgi:hypothetical protein
VRDLIQEAKDHNGCPAMTEGETESIIISLLRRFAGKSCHHLQGDSLVQADVIERGL